MEAENYFEETRLCVNLEYKYCREFCIVNSTTRPSSDSVVSSPKLSTSSLPPHYYCPDTLVYKMQPTTLLFTLLLTPLVSAKCDFQSVGILSKKWRLSTYKSQNCINKVQDVTKSGFGTWCIDIPNTTRSFIFSVGNGYNPLNMEDCSIFFKTKNNCGGDQVGKSRGEWKKGELSKEGETMASAYVQCTKLFVKREVEGKGERVYMRGEDGAWYEEVDGGLVKAREAVEEEEEE